MPAPGRRVPLPLRRLQLAYVSEEFQPPSALAAEQSDPSLGMQGPGQEEPVVVVLAVPFGRLRRGECPAQAAAGRLGERDRVPGGPLTQPRLLDDAQALVGDGQGRPTASALDLDLRETDEALAQTVGRAALTQPVHEGAQLGPCLVQLVAHQVEPVLEVERVRCGASCTCASCGAARAAARVVSASGSPRKSSRAACWVSAMSSVRRSPVRAASQAARTAWPWARGAEPPTIHVAPAHPVVQLGQQFGVAAGVAYRLREDVRDLGHRLAAGVDDHVPGAYPVGGPIGVAQYVVRELPGEVEVSGLDGVLGGGEPAVDVDVLLPGGCVLGGQAAKSRRGSGSAPAAGRRGGGGEAGRRRPDRGRRSAARCGGRARRRRRKRRPARGAPPSAVRTGSRPGAPSASADPGT